MALEIDIRPNSVHLQSMKAMLASIAKPQLGKLIRQAHYGKVFELTTGGHSALLVPRTLWHTGVGPPPAATPKAAARGKSHDAQFAGTLKLGMSTDEYMRRVRGAR